MANGQFSSNNQVNKIMRLKIVIQFFNQTTRQTFKKWNASYFFPRLQSLILVDEVNVLRPEVIEFVSNGTLHTTQYLLFSEGSELYSKFLKSILINGISRSKTRRGPIWQQTGATNIRSALCVSKHRSGYSLTVFAFNFF